MPFLSIFFFCFLGPKVLDGLRILIAYSFPFLVPLYISPLEPPTLHSFHPYFNIWKNTGYRFLLLFQKMPKWGKKHIFTEFHLIYVLSRPTFCFFYRLYMNKITKRYYYYVKHMLIFWTHTNVMKNLVLIFNVCNAFTRFHEVVFRREILKQIY